MTKRNRRLAGISAAAVAVLIASGCDQDLTDVNKNPNAPESVPVENVLLGGIWDVAANGGNRGAFGQWTQLYHGENWAQHIAQPVYNDEDQYTPRGGIPENIWTEMYYALTDLKTAKNLADGVNDNEWAIAEIMTVYGFMILTDYFGDIPYTEALRLDEGITAPAYDAQSDIYPDLIARLEAVTGRIDPGAVVTFEDYDPVYHGDMDGWIAFANSLRLRLAMRMVNADASAAEAAFADAWSSTLISSVDESADVDWEATQPAANPTYEGIVLAGRFGDFRMSNSFVSRLNAFNDPRLPIYAQPTLGDTAAVRYRGLINGLVPSEYTATNPEGDATNTANFFSQIGTYFLTATTPSPLMSYAQVLFLGAEAAYRGWIADDPETLYEAGITASMEELGVSSGDIATYLAQASVGYTTGTYQGLDAIHVQEWIDLFQAGPEAFTELRRIGWDWTTEAGTSGADLTPAEHSVLPAGAFPERLYYPPNEALYNPDNYPGSVALTDKLWWAP